MDPKELVRRFNEWTPPDDAQKMKMMRNDVLEEASRVAEQYARANINMNPNEDEATVASSVAQSIANTIRSLKS